MYMYFDVYIHTYTYSFNLSDNDFYDTYWRPSKVAIGRACKREEKEKREKEKREKEKKREEENNGQ